MYLKKNRPPEDTPRLLFVALGLWGIATVVAATSGVFAKLALAQLGALSLFAFLFAAITVYVDASLRDYLATASTRSYLTFIIEVDLGIAIGTMVALGLAEGRIAAALTTFPLAVVIAFALPVAGVAHLLLAHRLVRRAPVRIASRGASGSASVVTR
jgi:hypothetical protein